jgi:hypothetical protein
MFYASVASSVSRYPDMRTACHAYYRLTYLPEASCNGSVDLNVSEREMVDRVLRAYWELFG